MARAGRGTRPATDRSRVHDALRCAARHLRSLVGLVTVLALAACHPTPVYVGSGPKLATVGDSVTWYSIGPLKAALTGYSRWVWGITGTDLVQGRTSLVIPAVDTKPQVMVIELGINSVLRTWTPTASTALDGILADVAKVPCVIWVTPDALTVSNFDTWGPTTLHQRIAGWRALLAQRIAGHANVHQADWGAIEINHPEWYRSDGLHPNPAGEQALAAYVTQQVTSHCEPR